MCEPECLLGRDCTPGDSCYGGGCFPSLGAAGLRLPASCTQGMCGTCKTTKISGDVDLRHNGGIRPREVADGKVLPCVSWPLSDLRIDS